MCSVSCVSVCNPVSGIPYSISILDTGSSYIPGLSVNLQMPLFEPPDCMGFAEGNNKGSMIPSQAITWLE